MYEKLAQGTLHPNSNLICECALGFIFLQASSMYEKLAQGTLHPNPKLQCEFVLRFYRAMQAFMYEKLLKTLQRRKFPMTRVRKVLATDSPLQRSCDNILPQSRNGPNDSLKSCS